MPDFDPEAYLDKIHRMGKIAASLRHLSFDERVTLAHLLDLQIACCATCGCYIGKPECHDADDANDNEFAACCPCPELEEDDDDDTDGAEDDE